jgi:phosphatidylserine/phosphatidylglycerophosphate/cardiolipin synthase-like enzyme
MAKFINTRKAVSELEDLIRSAGERLILVSPFLKLSKDFRQLLEYRNSKDKITTVVFGKQELKPDEMRFLQGLRFVVLKFNEDLHAKCYVNDDKMIITSLNLYEFSMANNKEMGVIIDRNEPADAQLFQDAMNEVDFIQSTSQRFEFSAPVVQAVSANTTDRPVASSASRARSPVGDGARSSTPSGYCIRTGAEIPFNIKKPMSYEAYKQWNKDGDLDKPEKFCHFSGEPSDGDTTVSKPILKRNWKRAQTVHGF